MSDCFIKMPTKEEMEAQREEILAMQRKAAALTSAERMHLCDMGYYNETIKGYLIRAMKNADFDEEDIRRALQGLRWAFDETTAAEAAEIYRKF